MGAGRTLLTGRRLAARAVERLAPGRDLGLSGDPSDLAPLRLRADFWALRLDLTFPAGPFVR